MLGIDLDPQIKIESLWVGELLGRANLFAERRGPGVRIKNENGEWRQAMTSLDPFDSMMTHCADPREGIELLQLRETMRDWRFYDYFRTDREAPARRPQIGTYTPILASDGGDFAAALQTIKEIGDAETLKQSVLTPSPGPMSRLRSRRVPTSRSRCISMGSCAPCAPQNFPTAPCVICFWSQLC